MERETTPRCFFTAVTASWGILCTVLFTFPIAWHGLSYLCSTIDFHPTSHHLSPNPRYSPQPTSDEFTPFPHTSTAHFVPVPWTILQVNSLTHRIHPQHIFPSMSAQLYTELCSPSPTSFTAHFPVMSLLQQQRAAGFLGSVCCWHILKIMIPRCLVCVLPIKQASSECSGAAWTKYWRTCLS